MKRVGLFLARRIAGGALTVFVVVTLTFLMYWALAPQPGRFVYPVGIKITDYELSDGAHRLGADRPRLTQYGDWWWRLLHGDFGHMWTGATLNDNVLTTAPIGPELYPAIRVTLAILIGGAILTVLLAVPLGALSGRRIGSVADKVIAVGALVGVCTHPIVTGKLLTQWFGIDLRWLPAGGYCTFVRHPPPPNLNLPPGYHVCGGPVDWTTHMILPWITFAFLFLALYTRMIRASVAETLHEDFVRTARAKGASSARVVAHHVLPPAGLRVLTMIGMEIGTAFGICIYIESAFGMTGLARQAVFAMGGATSQIDLPFTLGIVVLVTLIVVIGNFLVDALYAVFDPRTGRESARGSDKPLLGGVF